MKKIILSLVTGALFATAANAAVFSYTFTGGDTEFPNGSSENLSFSQIQRVGVTTSAVAGSFRSTGWNQSVTTWDLNEYVGFTIQPTSGTLNISSITFQSARSVDSGSVKDGPLDGRIQMYVGNMLVYDATFTPNNTTLATPTLTTTFGSQAVSGTTETVSVRFYGKEAGHGNGSLSFDNIAVDGSTTPVPEPINVALALFGCTFAGIGIGRKLLKKKA